MFSLEVINFGSDPRLRTRVAVAQRIELFFDEEDGCGFESHQSHALSEAPGFRHLEPLSCVYLSAEVSQWLDFG